jgi:CRISPR-associated protein Csd1
VIIQALVKRYEDTQETPQGWQKQEVSYALDLSEDGKLLDIILLETPEPGGKKKTNMKKQVLTLPSTGSGRSGKNAYETAYFLCDNGSYMLGLDSRKFEAAQRLHNTLLKDVHTPAAQAIKAYFSAGIPVFPYSIEEKNASQKKFIFMVNGKRIDYNDCGAEIIHAWALAQVIDSEQIRCLVTGEMDNIKRLHDKVELRGVSMGKTPLISMNDQTSFRSYGKIPADPPAEIGEKAAFAYVSALNSLLNSRKNRQFIGRDTLVYWAESGAGAEEEVFSWVSDPSEDDADKLDALMKRAASGLPIVQEDCNLNSRFYLLCLSPNAGRISVRFFYVDSFGAILSNNITHYRRMEIVKAGKDCFRFQPAWMILSETTVKKQAPDVAPLLGGQYMRSILTGGRYPLTLYQSILNRVRAGELINKTKAAIVKAVLIKNYNESEVTTVALNTKTDNKPYALGRLFSVLEQLQQRASGGELSSTIRDRYFSSACANPGSVFPTLLKLSVHHSAKLDNAVYFERLKGELLGKLDVETPFPSALSLDDQGRFILGYYHQTQDHFTSKKDKEEQNND